MLPLVLSHSLGNLIDPSPPLPSCLTVAGRPGKRWGISKLSMEHGKNARSCKGSTHTRLVCGLAVNSKCVGTADLCYKGRQMVYRPARFDIITIGRQLH
ncbi:hypothetical protein GW17_00049810 [Ensete ventricosum]|nr:hypothetical protein GW17_00049810 [Ensete ventricosum]